MASRGALLIGALWVAGATAATSIGVLAVHLVATEVGDPVSTPLTSQGVRQALASVPPEPSSSPVASEDAGEQGPARTVSTVGGVVSARCRSGRPALLYATPADGFRTTRLTSGVRFVGARQVVTLTLGCRAGALRVAETGEAVGGAPGPTTPVPVETPEPEPTDG